MLAKAYLESHTKLDQLTQGYRLNLFPALVKLPSVSKHKTLKETVLTYTLYIDTICSTFKTLNATITHDEYVGINTIMLLSLEYIV